MQVALMQAALLPADPGLYAYLLLGVAIASQLPRWGRSVLAFLRDLDDYRANRQR
jgi:hypothetical protein